MKKIIFYMPDKSVVVRTPAIKSKRSDETEEQWLERTAQTNQRSMSYEIVEESALPQREHRPAWEGEKGKGITVNQVKANQIKDANERKRLIEEEKGKLAEKSLKDKGVIS